MKTTLTVNISGSIFVIDNDAYNLLDNYLVDIQARLKDNAGNTDTFQEIEIRVAELLTQMGASTIRVVTIDNVREVIRTIGAPEIFGDSSYQFNNYSNGGQKMERRVLRDPNNKTIGGVCAALALYFNVDPVIFKVLFVLTAIFGGSGVLAYFIMWLVIPEAKSQKDLEILERMKNER
ncbi:MAG: PspC domain-containing protein [Rikenellaceae bacterium]